jgi:hypothetical protein
MKKNIVLAFVTCFVFAANAAYAEELEMINRPVNLSGLTGLLYTTTPFTVPSNTVEISAAAISEKSTVPNYDINEMPSMAITVGFLDTMEFAVKSSYFHKSIQEGNKERGFGDTELSYKWTFLPQPDRPLPAVAFILTGIAPTSDKEAGIAGVTHWGARSGLSIGREIIWGDHVIGLYADGQLVVHDLNDQNLRDKYGMANAGILFPVSKYRNLQMLMEYSLVNGIDRITPEGGDYSAITYGLRVVTERINLSIGTQFVHKLVEGFENSSRVIGMMSVKF